ncbi:MAG TPA: hypothetical protein VNO82_18935 [Solirubrobacteraceae bacterium]|nr:hypothetical protein [Solirubrobacteraceae bacterium]
MRPAAATAIGFLVLGVVATGIGMVLLRLRAAGLTVGDTLGVVTLDEILAVGVSNMLLIAVAGLGGFGIAWGIGHKGTDLGHAVATTTLALAGILVAILLFEGGARVAALGVTVAAAVAALVVALATTKNRVHRWLKRNGRTLAIVAAALAVIGVGFVFLRGGLIVGGLFLVLVLLAAATLWLVLIPEDPRLSGLRRRCQWLGGCIRKVAGPGAVVLLAAILALLMGTWAMAVLVILAGVLIAALMRALPKEKELRPYALWVFAAVQVFGIALIALHAWEEPRFRPVAVLLADGTEKVGFLLSDAPGSVQVVDVERCHRDRRDLMLKPGRAHRDTATVSSVVVTSQRDRRIGDSMSMNQALDHAPRLLNELRAEAGLPQHKLAHPCADEGEVDQRRRAAVLLPPERARELAVRYRPVLHFDSGEPWRPVNVDQLLLERRLDGLPLHQACRAPWACEPLEDVAQLGGDVRYIDFGGTRLGGADVSAPGLDQCANRWAELLDCDRGPRSAIYYRAVSANDRVYVDYWWFLRYNRFRRWNAAELCSNRMLEPISEIPCGDHEGDWEGVTAVTATGDPQRLAYVSYASHEFTVRHPAGSGRPNVFVAEGSHAAYPKACPKGCRQIASFFVVKRPEENTDGKREWGRNDDVECADSCLLPLPESGWSTFVGAWGSETCESSGRACRLGHGPKSPPRQSRFRFPWCHTPPGAGRLECDTPPKATPALVE